MIHVRQSKSIVESFRVTFYMPINSVLFCHLCRTALLVLIDLFENSFYKIDSLSGDKMPSTKQDAIDYVATSDMDADDKAYWKGQQNPFQPTFTLTLPPLASEFKMTDRVFADVKTRLYTKSTHAKTSLLVVLPGGTLNTLLPEQSTKQVSQGPPRAESIGMRTLLHSVVLILFMTFAHD